MQKVFMIGNLTRTPELTETNSGIKICRFSIAVNRNYSGADGERQTDFFNIVAWRGLAETAARYLKKGNKVAVSGSIELRNYEDSQGVKRTGVD
ncbi:MAG: single-stranded DNA-binding protein, partial [Clostridia bacterium]|nr:single-stranded DNA-binding protein [Clostridia bacterium]